MELPSDILTQLEEAENRLGDYHVAASKFGRKLAKWITTNYGFKASSSLGGHECGAEQVSIYLRDACCFVGACNIEMDMYKLMPESKGMNVHVSGPLDPHECKKHETKRRESE